MRRILTVLPILGVLLAARSTRAQGEDAAAGLLALALLPALGPEARFRSDVWVDTRFVFAWPFQIPLSGPFGPSVPHRLVLAPELVALSSAEDGGNDDTFLRLRLGYRGVVAERLIAGLGLTADAESSLSISPELGVRTRGYGSWFLIARVERSLIEDDPLRANLLAGFSFY